MDDAAYKPNLLGGFKNNNHSLKVQMKKFWANLVLATGSIFISLLVAELALRVMGISYPFIYKLNDHSGTAHRPGATGIFSTEGYSHVTINSHGMRDVEYTLEKPRDVFRVAVFGDSFTEALQVELEASFSKVMERELASCPALRGKQAEVLNFGVSGHGTAQSLQRLRYEGWNFDPDLVVLAFLTGNDIRNNHRALEGDPYRPYFTLQNGTLALDDSFTKDSGYIFRKKISGIYDLVKNIWVAQLALYAKGMVNIYLSTPNNPTPPAKGETVQQAAKGSELGLDNAVYLPPPDQNWEEAWAVSKALVVQMDQEVKKRGKPFLLTTLSNGIQVNPNSEKSTSFFKKLGVTDPFYPDHQLALLAEKHKIAHLTLAPMLQKWAEKNHTCVHGFNGVCDGHWNQNGHRLAGQAMAKEVCRLAALKL